MEKPPYELEALKAAVLQHDKNIAALEEGIRKEKEAKEQVRFYIKQHERYLKSRKNTKSA